MKDHQESPMVQLNKVPSRALVVAEIGVNHNGDVSTATQMIEEAASAGADAVKFQTYDAQALVSEGARLANYQAVAEISTSDQLSMLKRLQLSQEEHKILNQHSKKFGVEFMSTAFDFHSLEFLSQEMDLKRLKIGSGEITNGPFLLAHANIGLPIILSTGMASTQELDDALAVIGCGLLGKKLVDRSDLESAWQSPEVTDALKKKVTLLQCTTQYPAPINEANLRAMSFFRRRYGVSAGYSDHTLGKTTAIVAVALGAKVIEKHFTLDKTMPGPDQKASLEPQEFKELVEAIRSAEASLGEEKKKTQPCELENLDIARKSLYAARTISAGQRFSEKDIEIKKPAGGMSPMRYWEILGSIAREEIPKGKPIR